MPQHIVVILDIKDVVELIAACDNILYKVFAQHYRPVNLKFSKPGDCALFLKNAKEI